MSKPIFGRTGVPVLVCAWILGIGGAVRAADPDPSAEAESRRRAEQKAEFATLKPVPDPPAGRHPVDALLDAWQERQKVESEPKRLADAPLVRKLYLDIIGLPPTPEQVEAFVKDQAPDKVEKLVRKLLNDRQGYAEHWMTFWNDLFRNDEQTSIDGLRKPITGWLYSALRDNKPYDRMVSELLNPGKGGPDGYLKGVNWRGRVNLSQRPAVQAAQNVAQVFLATSIRCASCHDGFTTHWKLKEAYGLAAFFSEETLEMARCDKPTGVFIPAKFLYPDLGEVAPDADLPTRHAAVAKMVTRPKNPRFAKVLVNRLWEKLMGRGLAEPIDELDEPDFPEVLDWLAYDLMKHDYDLKRTLELILTSSVYARPARELDPEAETIEPDPVPRRLSGEQFLDALASVTGSWPKPKALMNVAIPGDRVRAWRDKRPSALVVALGRPNREQVVTRRVQDPTVLQALEATNGATLTERIRQGAETLLASDWSKEPDAARRVDELWRRAFGRPATRDEHALADDLLAGNDSEALKASLEDVLWMVVNSAEFQVLP